jgi:hypothetical protein
MSFYVSVLHFWKKKKSIFKIAIHGDSLWHLPVYMYYNQNWFIPSILVLSTLVIF